MVFVDFKKAFDSSDGDGVQMFKILQAYGIPNKIIDAIKIIYYESAASVITPVGISEFFQNPVWNIPGRYLIPFLVYHNHLQ